MTGFWALTAITDANPITKKIAGNMAAMTEAWLRWGRNVELGQGPVELRFAFVIGLAFFEGLKDAVAIGVERPRPTATMGFAAAPLPQAHP